MSGEPKGYGPADATEAREEKIRAQRMAGEFVEDDEDDELCRHGVRLGDYCSECREDAESDLIDRAHEEGKAIARGESC